MRPFTVAEFVGAKLGVLPLPVYDAFHAVLLGRALAAGVELGLFDALDRRPETAASLSRELPLPEESAALLLGTLEAAGYLIRRGDTFALRRSARRWLTSGSPQSLTNFIRYVALLHRKWLDLAETLRAGRPRHHYAGEFSAAEWRTYVLGMRDLARLLLPSVARAVTVPRRTAVSLLDVGGSHGAYTAAFCERHENLRGTIVDLPQALAVAAEVIAQSPAAARISLHGADITREDLPGSSVDIAFLFNVIHGFSAEENTAILRRLAGLLAGAGGTLYLLDQFRDVRGRGTGRLLPYLVGLNLMNEAGGTAYDLHAVKRWCLEAGFRTVRTVRTGMPGVAVLAAAT